MEQKLKYNTLFVNISAGITGLIALLIITVISLNLDKGFELSDESYYVMASRYPHDQQLLNSQFGLVNFCFTLGHTSLLQLRVFKLIYQIVSLLIFSRAFAMLLGKNTSWPSGTMFLATLTMFVVGFVNYDYLPMTLSYNSWSFNFSLLFWSAIMYKTANQKVAGNYIADIVSGFILLCLFFVKTPNAVILLVIELAHLLFFRRKNVLVPILMQVSGVFGGVILLFGSVARFIESSAVLYSNLTTIRHASLGGYLPDLFTLFTQRPGTAFFLFQAVLFIVMYLFRKKKYPFVTGLIVIFLNSLCSLKFIEGNGADISNDFLFGLVFAINAMLFFTLLYSKGVFKDKAWLVFIAAGLTLTPILMALGTANPIVYSSSHYLAFTFAGSLMFLFGLNNNLITLFTAWHAPLSAFCIGAILYQGFIKNPYRQTDLSDKKDALYFSKEFENIKESSQRLVAYKQLTEKLRNHNSHALAVMSSPPGLGGVLMAGMQPFAVYWLADDEKDAVVNDAYFSKFDFKKKRPFLLISSRIKYSGLQRAVFAKHGLDLDKNYTTCDSVFSELNQEYIYFMDPFESKN